MKPLSFSVFTVLVGLLGLVQSVVLPTAKSTKSPLFNTASPVHPTHTHNDTDSETYNGAWLPGHTQISHPRREGETEVGSSAPLLTLSTVTDYELPRLLPLAPSSPPTNCNESTTIHNITRHIPTRTSPPAAPATPFVSTPTVPPLTGIPPEVTDFPFNPNTTLVPTSLNIRRSYAIPSIISEIEKRATATSTATDCPAV
jgi:hypothetical protein